MTEKREALRVQDRDSVPGKKPLDRAAIALKTFVPASKMPVTDLAADAINHLKKVHKMAHYNPKKKRWECAACGKHGGRGKDARDLSQEICRR